MNLGTKTRYAARALLMLASTSEDDPVSAAEIAADQDVSTKYLEHLLSSLRSAGIVKSIRGSQGGYILARPPDGINLRQVYQVFEGTEGFVECATNPNACPRSDGCVTRGVWAQMYETSMQILEDTTLEDLVKRAEVVPDSGIEV